MPITRNLRDMFDAPGNPPDGEPTVIHDLVSNWLTERPADDHVRSSTAPFYASDGAGCARRAAYDYLSRTLPDAPEPSDPPTEADEWTFHMGNTAHETIQQYADRLGYESEVRAVLQRDGKDFVSTRADLYHPENGTVVELKSKNGYGFKLMATTFKGEPEGPNWGHVVQLALSVKALLDNGKHVTQGVLAYLGLEKLSPSMATDFSKSEIGRFAAQWTYDVVELVDLADEVIEWLSKIEAKITSGEMPPRVFNDPAIPRQAVIRNPSTGAWVVKDKAGEILRAGDTWMCRYCKWQTRCTSEQ